jgi:hypothetical protein
MAVQKGLFLFPCNIAEPLETNLCSSFKFPFRTLDSDNAEIVSWEVAKSQLAHNDFYGNPSIVKIKLKEEWNKAVLTDLYHMNIDSASLFPGLDGFTRSLKFIIQSDEFTPGELGGHA